MSTQVMVSRMALIVWLLESKLVFWLYEQPATSIMWQHPRMQQLIRGLTVWRAHMYMGSYGAASPKPTHLWSPSPIVSMFSLPLPKCEWEQVVDRTVLSNGKVSVSGNKNLKAPQTYPREFGFATIRVWQKAGHRNPPESTPKEPNVWDRKADRWRDAELTDIMQNLSLGTFK